MPLPTLAEVYARSEHARVKKTARRAMLGGFDSTQPSRDKLDIVNGIVENIRGVINESVKSDAFGISVEPDGNHPKQIVFTVKLEDGSSRRYTCNVECEREIFLALIINYYAVRVYRIIDMVVNNEPAGAYLDVFNDFMDRKYKIPGVEYCKNVSGTKPSVGAHK